MTLLFGLSSLLSAGVYQDDDGWTNFEASPDSRIVYVSDSEGNDSNDGLSPATPVKTINRGISKLRPGNPDWMLLKRGDTWTDQTLGYWNRQGGRSADEPMVISYYGDGAAPRPRLLTGGECGMKADGRNSSGSPDHRRIDHLAIVGLHLNAHTYDGTETDSWGMRPVGIRWFAGTEKVLIEDCMIEGYGGGITVQAGYGQQTRNVTLRRNVIVDNWAAHPDALTGRAQGIYTNEIHGLLIEENFLDHNGWKEGVANAGPDIYSHNMYIQSTNYDVVVRGNISARASSHGLQLRPGGIAEGNLFVEDSIAFFVGNGDGDGSDNLAVDNVVVHGSRKGLRPDGYSRGFGIHMKNIAGAEAIRNIVAHGANCKKGLTGLENVYTENNVVYQWGTETDPGLFPDPWRTMYTYDAALGGPGTVENFLSEVRQMSKQNWRPEYAAAGVVPYFQEAFGLIGLPPLIPGDANRDGVVSDADYTVWADHYGESQATWAMGDFNGNGTVTEADYTIWADNYGATAGGMPVPEPATALIFVATGLLIRRR